MCARARRRVGLARKCARAPVNADLMSRQANDSTAFPTTGLNCSARRKREGGKMVPFQHQGQRVRHVPVQPASGL